MNDLAKDSDYINLKITPRELRYFISCGSALILNVPGKSLPTYCGLDKDEIIEVSKRLRKIADNLGIEM